ncbi:hypothetical protein D0C36_06515 [Mucilaginibacter conchicola]|uniref:DoxX family protein n=1 Tax=Mucilaginibacter conchicola TaxID=2303333 RepID=A0A372NYI1_9SPHI|nr:hypothetical protein [Mucilaginibacter conchicola]RFZ95176.1 hypothetical protein D0C36_06515 [Mucilaginibacter conchicola]
MTTNADEPLYWSAPRKIAVRFFLVFFLLYMFFNPNGVLPYSDILYELYIPAFHNLAVWLGNHILHLKNPITVFTNGSGDTTYDYVMLLLMFVTALVSTLIWTIADRRVRNYNRLFYWLTVVVRYYVAVTMVTYGFVKIIKLQFPYPDLNRLLEPIGDTSPMGLAWTYMGYSTGFNLFTGLGELACGLLLFFRRTATLGALLGLVVAGNIMAINYSFDVPVKLLSTMLTVMSMFLLFKDAVRLTNFFLLNKPAAPANLGPHKFKKRWANITAAVVKYALIFFVLAGNIENDVNAMSNYGTRMPKPPLYGIYQVQSFVRNRDTIPPLTTDSTRWNKLILAYTGGARVKMMNDSIKRYDWKIDTIKRTIVMFNYADTANKAYYTYTLPKKGELLMKGKDKADSVYIRMTQFDLKKFRLNSRGFNWINEYPYNR